MAKVIVSGGCSFAYGFNLDQRSDRYAVHIAKAYDKDLIDVSVAGCSNENIGSSMAVGIYQALQRYNKKDIVAIVGWTDMMRYEAWNKFRNRIQSLFMDESAHRHGTTGQKDTISLQIAANASFVARHLWNVEWSYYKLVHAFNYVNAVCKSHGIPVVHKPSITLERFPFVRGDVQFSKNKNEWYTENVIPAEDIMVFSHLFKAQSFLDLTRKDPYKYQIEAGYDSHPNATAHAEWADAIMEQYGDILGA